MQSVIVIGAGGHAKVVISTLRAAGYEVSAVLDDNPARWGSTVLEVPVLGAISELRGQESPLGVIAIGSNLFRKEIAEQYTHVKWLTAVHPHACVDPTVRLGKGTVVFAGAVIQPDTVVGEHVIINTGASVDHDSIIADYAHIAPGAHLAGGVRIERGVLMGVGSCAVPNSRVGEWTLVGAGAVVVRDLPERVAAVGVPAVPLKNPNGLQ